MDNIKSLREYYQKDLENKEQDSEKKGNALNNAKKELQDAKKYKTDADAVLQKAQNQKSNLEEQKTRVQQEFNATNSKIENKVKSIREIATAYIEISAEIDNTKQDKKLKGDRIRAIENEIKKINEALVRININKNKQDDEQLRLNRHKDTLIALNSRIERETAKSESAQVVQGNLDNNQQAQEELVDAINTHVVQQLSFQEKPTQQDLDLISNQHTQVALEIRNRADDLRAKEAEKRALDDGIHPLSSAAEQAINDYGDIRARSDNMQQILDEADKLREQKTYLDNMLASDDFAQKWNGLFNYPYRNTMQIAIAQKIYNNPELQGVIPRGPEEGGGALLIRRPLPTEQEQRRALGVVRDGIQTRLAEWPELQQANQWLIDLGVKYEAAQQAEQTLENKKAETNRDIEALNQQQTSALQCLQQINYLTTLVETRINLNAEKEELGAILSADELQQLSARRASVQTLIDKKQNKISTARAKAEEALQNCRQKKNELEREQEADRVQLSELERHQSDLEGQSQNKQEEWQRALQERAELNTNHRHLGTQRAELAQRIRAQDELIRELSTQARAAAQQLEAKQETVNATLDEYNDAKAQLDYLKNKLNELRDIEKDYLDKTKEKEDAKCEIKHLVSQIETLLSKISSLEKKRDKKLK